MAHNAIEVISKIISTGLLIFQGIMVNLYLTKVYCPAWWSWIVADVAVLIVWVFCSLAIWKSFSKKKKDFVDGRDPEQSPNGLKYTYIAWLSYVALLIPRVALLFAERIKTLNESETLGPNFLKMAVSCTPMIFFLLVHGSHNSKAYTSRYTSIQVVAAAGAIDLFDSIDLLDFLFIPYGSIHFPHVGYLRALLVFACASFFLPALSLYGLQYKILSGRVSPFTFKAINVSLNLIVINIPNMVIRSILWHKYGLDVSVLLMKNVMGIVAGVYEIIPYFGRHSPKLCKKCGDWFEKGAYSNHNEVCVGYRGSTVEDAPLTEV